MNKLVGASLIAGGVAAGYALSSLLPIGSLKPSPSSDSECAWSPQLDAVAAAPGNHRVVLENEHVRVLDVTVRPGEREPVHAHCRPSVMYLMQEGIYRDYDGEGRLIEEVTASPPANQFPMTLWLGPQAPHSVHNLDSKPTRLLRIELKQ